MTNYYPITATLSPIKNELILVNPAMLRDQFGINIPVIVDKTAILIEGNEYWRIILEDNGQRDYILTDEHHIAPDGPLDVIDILGHGLILQSWQKLILSTDGAVEQCISYLHIP